MGAVLGLVTGRALTNDFSSSEFEALGTWAGTFVTIGALVLAYIVHRTEAAAREADQYAQRIRQYNERKALEESEAAVRRLEREDAELVKATVTVFASENVDDETRTLNSVKATLLNRSTSAATDVVLEVPNIGLKRNWIVLEPASREVQTPTIRPAAQIPRDGDQARELIREHTRLRFTMHKRKWVWSPVSGLSERG
ncbi:hypothetical protein CLV56_2479 [Mumia flava]|uniref:Uncharacterized protein n=1 Tax=Mumia flava TaxID=1348852 RepID=A0A2M9BJU2_9ACTN|nr:hypothetical protein [Mumia flava]PJJ58233.1 hypothetical protein CLV56_2479 [Mumia flava]